MGSVQTGLQLSGLEPSGLHDANRRAVFGLWAVPGVGAQGLAKLCREVPEPAALLDVPVDEWVGAFELTEETVRRLRARGSLAAVAERVAADCARGGVSVCFRGDAAYPEHLAALEDAPPLLFYVGPGGSGRRRLAMVGTRRPEPGFVRQAQALAEEVASRGITVVSGGALGVDMACHAGAIAAGRETWAFAGSGLLALDAPQAELLPALLSVGGTFYSELPPRVRASKMTFPRRNRLISGASDAVLVLRAGANSGTRHTVEYARKQGRPVLAWPGEPSDPTARLCNALIQEGAAQICLSAEDACKAAGVAGGAEGSELLMEAAGQADLSELSEAARTVYGAMARRPRRFEEVQRDSGIEAGSLVSALCELELAGLVIQHPGKLYERIQ